MIDKGLKLFINSLENISNSLQNGNNGEEFENFIMQELSKEGTKASLNIDNDICINRSFKKKITKKKYEEIFKKLKNDILDKDNINLIVNPFKEYLNNDNHIYIYIYQPFGSQNFPDFIIITNNYVFPFETKFSTKYKKEELPKWNSNIPKANSIYAFASKMTENPILFLGGDYISDDVRRILIKHFEEFDEKTKETELIKKIQNLDDKKRYNPFGLYPKIRTDFLKKNDFVFGNENKLNIFEFSKSMDWKNRLINFLTEIMNYEE